MNSHYWLLHQTVHERLSIEVSSPICRPTGGDRETLNKGPKTGLVRLTLHENLQKLIFARVFGVALSLRKLYIFEIIYIRGFKIEETLEVCQSHSSGHQILQHYTI